MKNYGMLFVMLIVNSLAIFIVVCYKCILFFFCVFFCFCLKEPVIISCDLLRIFRLEIVCRFVRSSGFVFHHEGNTHIVRVI